MNKLSLTTFTLLQTVTSVGLSALAWAVTGVPSWKVASLRRVNVHDIPSDAICQLSASSGANALRS